MHVSKLGLKSSAIKISGNNEAKTVEKRIQELQKQIEKVQVDSKLSATEKDKKVKNLKSQMKILQMQKSKSGTKASKKTQGTGNTFNQKRKSIKPSVDIKL